MIKKISIYIISLAIIIIGIRDFNRLNYWERSIRILKTSGSQPFGREVTARNQGSDMNRDRGGRGDRNGENIRPDFRNMPDSVRQKLLSERNFPSQPDSLRRSGGREFPGGNGDFRGRGFDGGRRDGFDQQRKNVRLTSVLRFLSIFAAFTTLTIYLDKIIRVLIKKKKLPVK